MAVLLLEKKSCHKNWELLEKQLPKGFFKTSFMEGVAIHYVNQSMAREAISSLQGLCKIVLVGNMQPKAKRKPPPDWEELMS